MVFILVFLQLEDMISAQIERLSCDSQTFLDSIEADSVGMDAQNVIHINIERHKNFLLAFWFWWDTIQTELADLMVITREVLVSLQHSD